MCGIRIRQRRARKPDCVMNVLFLTPNVDRSCGRSQHVLALMSELAGRGHSCVLGTNGGTLLEKFPERGICCEMLPIDPEKKSPGSFWTTLRKLKQIVRDHNIGIIHSHHRWPELIASYSARCGMRVRTVSTCHNLRRGKVFLSYRSDSIIAVSEAVRELLVGRFHVDESRVVSIHQAARPVPTPDEREIRRFEEEHGIQAADCVVAGVGRFHREKGFDVMVKAAMLQRDGDPGIRWLLAGNGEERVALEREIEARDLDVTIVDAIENIGVVYARADVLVVPSRDDAMPLVPLEAARFALPVVATSVGGLPETISNNVTGKLVPPERPDELLRAVVELLTDRHLAADCGRNLKKMVEREYSLADMVSRTEELYRSLLN